MKLEETEILIYKGNMYASEKVMSESTLGERALKRLTFRVEGSERPWNAPRDVRITYLCAWTRGRAHGRAVHPLHYPRGNTRGTQFAVSDHGGCIKYAVSDEEGIEP